MGQSRNVASEFAASVPIAYGMLILNVAQQLGVPRARMLDGLDLDEATLARADARLELAQMSRLLFRAQRYTDNPALGYEIGLHSSLSTHGYVGYGLLALPDVRSALEFGLRFVQLRTPFVRLSLQREGAQAVIEVQRSWPLGEVDRTVMDLFPIGLWRMAPQLSGDKEVVSRFEIHFDCPRPAHFERYAARLPVVHFEQAANQLRFPVGLLDAALQMADPTTAQLLTDQCERELDMLGGGGVTLGQQVRALLQSAGPPYLNLEQVAQHLHLSSRSLKRRLQQESTRFSQLLEELRAQEAARLLQETPWNVARLAEHMGYADPANFTRAFRKWHGCTPSQFRRAGA